MEHTFTPCRKEHTKNVACLSVVRPDRIYLWHDASHGRYSSYKEYACIAPENAAKHGSSWMVSVWRQSADGGVSTWQISCLLKQMFNSKRANVLLKISCSKGGLRESSVAEEVQRTCELEKALLFGVCAIWLRLFAMLPGNFYGTDLFYKLGHIQSRATILITGDKNTIEDDLYRGWIFQLWTVCGYWRWAWLSTNEDQQWEEGHRPPWQYSLMETLIRLAEWIVWEGLEFKWSSFWLTNDGGLPKTSGIHQSIKCPV